tara:strand:- start:352 stop:1128 length:777 start_codon:yes stop_codon:yes gene_type:complete
LQQLVVTSNVVSVTDPAISSCLGADCTTGVWLMLGMIEQRIEGVYVVHAAEELGCMGSAALVKDNPYWLTGIDAVISFDRYGDTSVITHQMGRRTASAEFATSFADALDLPQLIADPNGSYTDSNEYANVVSECTNISVGYYGQHGVNETQDLEFADLLMYKLCAADWSKLVIARDPSLYESQYEDEKWWCSRLYGDVASQDQCDDYDRESIISLIEDNTYAVADMLIKMGMTPELLAEEAGVDDGRYINDYINRRYM